MAPVEPALVISHIIVNREIAPDQFLLSLRLPSSFPTPAPGQFVMLKASDCETPLLPRPFSVYAFNRKKNHSVMEIIYRIAGQGTRRLSSLPPSLALRVMGPQGQGFTVSPDRKNMILIAGGIGLAPLSFLARDSALFHRITFYAGAKTASALVGLQRLEEFCSDLKISTDDGSRGFPGTVNKLFRRDIARYKPEDTAVYACGPAPMLKELAEILLERGIFCQVSTEERMACGLGACLGCALPTRGRDGCIVYKRVCKEGPVFNIAEIAWG